VHARVTLTLTLNLTLTLTLTHNPRTFTHKMVRAATASSSVKRSLRRWPFCSFVCSFVGCGFVLVVCECV